MIEASTHFICTKSLHIIEEILQMVRFLGGRVAIRFVQVLTICVFLLLSTQLSAPEASAAIANWFGQC
jgi:hypothetical protein